MNVCKTVASTLGGLVVACLPLDPRFEGSNPAEDNVFLRAIKIWNIISFGGEVKLSVPCCKILQHVKEPSSKKTHTL
jgi:hypothetical protein